MTSLHWKWGYFKDFSALEVYELLKLRQEVFIVEQKCIYLDADAKDLKALHLLGYSQSQELLACARVILPGLKFPEISIGRVATHTHFRSQGLGKDLMKNCIQFIERDFGMIPIRISAQEYLRKFYESFRFRKVSDSYLEDEIPHIEMLRD